MKDKSSYRHGLILLYLPIYLLCFFLLEQRTGTTYYIIHSPIDDFIPFCEYFILPYLLWFPYLIGTAVLLFCHSGSDLGKKEFLSFAWQIVIGLSVCLLIYFIWPNGLNLRPAVYPRDNVFTDLCRLIQSTDTPGNVCPSIHVYSSIVVHASLCKCHRYQKKRSVHLGSLILLIAICLSTMFLKQHSIIDVIAAFILYGIFQIVRYYLNKKTPLVNHS